MADTNMVKLIEKAMKCLRELLDFFWVFLKVGAMTFGGGYAMMPILQREVVQGRGWANEQEVLDYYAVGQCLPGLNSVNVAIFVGYQNRKTAGAVAAALGLVTPSIIIITIIASLLGGVMELAVVQNAFAAVRVAVCALVLQAAVTMTRGGVVDGVTAAIFVAVLAGVLLLGLSPVIVVLASAVVGIVVTLVRTRRAK